MEDEFLEEVYEIAFGAGAIEKDYTTEEVLNKLKEFSNKALYFEDFMYEEQDVARAYYRWLEEG